VAQQETRDIVTVGIGGRMKATTGAAFVRKCLAAQPFWVTVAVVVICAGMSWLEPDSFPTRDNFFNITRNFAYIGIMALGMMAVIITGGIDLSVGSVMGLTGIICGLVLQAGHSWWLAVLAGLGAGALCGLVNGAFVAYVGLPSFVVTLGMLAAARSFAVVLSENKMIYDFGPDGDAFMALGGGEIAGISNMVWLLLAMTLLFGFVFRFTRWGRHVYAVGGNEAAARLAGVAVNRIKLQTYTLCALTAAIAAIMVVGWQGSAINALGTGYELRVIASTVIGGANLMGGEGGAYAALIGATLIEVIRNSLLMAGIDSNWQGAFVGAFIVLAVLLERIRGSRAD
jgi:ribose transport system permease protein